MMRDFLYLEGDIVKINDQAMTLPEVKRVYSMDKHKGKPFFNRVITYIYYMYHRDSIYRNLDEPVRRNKIRNVYFPEIRKPYFWEDERIKAMVDVYNFLAKSRKERIFDTMLKDLEDMMDHLATIKFQKTIDETHTVFVKCPAKGEEIPVDVKVKKVIDNSQEKLKAMKLIEEALEREETLRKKIEKERLLEAAGGQSMRRMFDR